MDFDDGKLAWRMYLRPEIEETVIIGSGHLQAVGRYGPVRCGVPRVQILFADRPELYKRSLACRSISLQNVHPSSGQSLFSV